MLEAVATVFCIGGEDGDRTAIVEAIRKPSVTVLEGHKGT